MPDNSQRHDAMPNQGAGPIDRNMGETIYARHARFVWPTSIASSLAQRFAHFTDQRLPLAAILQRRWSIPNSSIARMPDLLWLHAFAPNSPRNAISARQHDGVRTIPASPSPSAAVSPAPEVALSEELRRPQISAVELAPSTSISQPTGASSSQRFPEISRAVTSYSAPETPNHDQREPDSSMVESAHHKAPDVSRDAESNAAPTADRDQEPGHGLTDRPVQVGSRTTHRLQEISREAGLVSASTVPDIQSSGYVKATAVPGWGGRTLAHPVTVYNAPPIIRRSFASRQVDIVGAEFAGGQMPSPSNNIPVSTAQKSSDGVQVPPSIPSESTMISPRTDRMISEGADTQLERTPSPSVAQRSIAPVTKISELHHINQFPVSPRIESAVAAQAGLAQSGQSSVPAAQCPQLSSHGVTSRSVTPTAATSKIVSRECPISHNSSSMTHAVARSRDASPEVGSPEEPSAARSSAREEQVASHPGQIVSESGGLLQSPTQPVPQTSQDVNSVPLVARHSEHEGIVVPESHTDTPATEMLHRNESADPALTGPRTERTGQSTGPDFPLQLMPATSDSIQRSLDDSSAANVVSERGIASLSSPILHLRSDSGSSATSPPDSLDTSGMNIINERTPTLNEMARSYSQDSIAASPASPASYAKSPIQTSRHSAERGLLSSDLRESRLLRRSEPIFRSMSAILRSTGTFSPYGPSGSAGLARQTMVPVVVQESAANGQAELLVLSHSTVSREPFQHLSTSGLSANIAAATSSSPAVSIAAESVGFMHRRPSPMVRAGSFGSIPVQFASLPVSRQAAADIALPSTEQPPSLPAMSGIAANAPSLGAKSPDITQLANRVYEVLVRRLASERQRRGR